MDEKGHRGIKKAFSGSEDWPGHKRPPSSPGPWNPEAIGWFNSPHTQAAAMLCATQEEQQKQLLRNRQPGLVVEKLHKHSRGQNSTGSFLRHAIVPRNRQEHIEILQCWHYFWFTFWMLYMDSSKYLHLKRLAQSEVTVSITPGWGRVEGEGGQVEQDII